LKPCWACAFGRGLSTQLAALTRGDVLRPIATLVQELAQFF
jgi:hypothetical protein